jgi:hypothetical protein
MEHLAEDLGWRTEAKINEHRKSHADYFELKRMEPPSTLGMWKAEVTQDYLTLSFVGQIVGLLRGIRQYYGPIWSTLLGKLSWTSKDEELVKKVTEVPLPTLLTDREFLQVNAMGSKNRTYSPYVEYAYQEKDYAGLCLTKTHSWCSPDVKLGRPCLLRDCRDALPQRAIPCQHRLSPFEPSRGETLENWRKQLFIKPQLRVRIPKGLGGRFTEDMLHVSGAASREEMHVQYYRGQLNALSKTGHELLLPQGVTAAATWCTGSDIWNQNLMVRDEQGKLTLMPPVRCEASVEAVYREEQLCDEIERCLFNGAVFNSDGTCSDPWAAATEEDKEAVKALIGLGIGEIFKGIFTRPNKKEGSFLGLSPNPAVAELEQRYGTAPGALAIALSKLPPGAELKIVEPSPLGQASLIWSDQEGMQNVVSIHPLGSVVKWRGLPR